VNARNLPKGFEYSKEALERLKKRDPRPSTATLDRDPRPRPSTATLDRDTDDARRREYAR
jgi:hypothetical protein